MNAFYRNLQKRQEMLSEANRKAGKSSLINDGQRGDLRIDESRAGARPTVQQGNTGYMPQPINYQPRQFSGLGQMPSIREAAFGNVMQPFTQQNWGLAQIDPRLLTTSGFLGSGLAGSRQDNALRPNPIMSRPQMVRRFA